MFNSARRRANDDLVLARRRATLRRVCAASRKGVVYILFGSEKKCNCRLPLVLPRMATVPETLVLQVRWQSRQPLSRLFKKVSIFFKKFRSRQKFYLPSLSDSMACFFFGAFFFGSAVLASVVGWSFDFIGWTRATCLVRAVLTSCSFRWIVANDFLSLFLWHSVRKFLRNFRDLQISDFFPECILVMWPFVVPHCWHVVPFDISLNFSPFFSFPEFGLPVTREYKWISGEARVKLTLKNFLVQFLKH